MRRLGIHKALWKREVPPTETQYGWGTSISPVIYKDRLYIVNDNSDESYLLALNKRTGEVIYRIERDEKTKQIVE